MNPIQNRYGQKNMSGLLDDVGLGDISKQVTETLDNVDMFTKSVTIAVWVLGGLAVAWLYFFKKN